MIRVLIADDHPFVRRGIRETLADAQVAEVVAEAVNGTEALRLLREEGDRIDVAILDMSMSDPDRAPAALSSGLDGLEVISRIASERPELPILVVTMHPAAQVGRQVLRAGARGFLSKLAPPHLVAEAVEALATGRHYVSPELARLLGEDVAGGGEAPLSVQELAVVRSVAKGARRAQTAAQLSLSPTTVSTYKRRAMDKLGVTSDAELIRKVIALGIAE